MLTFAHPWLLLLLPLPWLIRRYIPPRTVSEIAVRVPFGRRLRIATGGGETPIPQGNQRANLGIATLIWLLLLGALARPQWLEPPISKNLPTRDLLLLVDLSASMNQQDFTNQEGQRVDRLTAVKEVVGDFLEQRQGDRVGLVVFGDAAFLQAPFSTDLNLSRTLLEETVIGMAGPRTAFGDAIGLGISLFEESDAPAKTIIALTDGNDTASKVPPVEAARVAAQRDIRIHTVAIGDPTTLGEDKLDEVTLRETAEVTGGSYFFAADREQLAGIYQELDQIETQEIDVVSHRPRRDLFPWLVLAALLFSMGEKGLRAIRQMGEKDIESSRNANVRVNPVTGELEVTTS